MHAPPARPRRVSGMDEIERHDWRKRERRKETACAAAIAGPHAVREQRPIKPVTGRAQPQPTRRLPRGQQREAGADLPQTEQPQQTFVPLQPGRARDRAWGGEFGHAKGDADPTEFDGNPIRVRHAS